MIAFIIYGFKIVTAVLLAALLPYNPGKNRETLIIRTTLIAMLSGTIFNVIRQSGSGAGIFAGLAIIGMFYFIIKIFRRETEAHKFLYLFAGVIGLICAYGQIFEAIIFTAIAYFIFRYYLENGDSAEEINQEILD